MTSPFTSGCYHLGSFSVTAGLGGNCCPAGAYWWRSELQAAKRTNNCADREASEENHKDRLLSVQKQSPVKADIPPTRATPLAHAGGWRLCLAGSQCLLFGRDQKRRYEDQLEVTRFDFA